MEEILKKALSIGLNVNLIKKNNLNEKEIEELIYLYSVIDNIFKLEEEMKNNNIDIKKLREFDKQLRNIEYRIQELWHFEKNSNFHKYWFLQPLCSCPKLDNKARLGTDNFIINENCIIHGNI
jgi:molybdenum cofactor biosynthesis enzyme MoaA